jgi:hypothetical protein
MRLVAALPSLLIATVAVAAVDDPAPIGYSSVAGVLQALRADPRAQFQDQQGWTVVASREGEHAVEWFFPPVDHPAYPSVIRRTVLEENGVGLIDLAALCQVPQSDCDLLLDDFRQYREKLERVALAELVTLDVGVALNDHDRLRIKRLLTEEGKAAEIRMDNVFKAVIVPTLDDSGAVMLWTARYEFDGAQYVLLAEPQFATPGAGTAQFRIASESGTTFGFSITRLLASE